MQYFNLLTAILCASSGAAMAQCPTQADMAGGIRFGLASGETETFRDLGDGVIEAIFKASDPPASRVLLGHGVYLLELVDVENGLPQPGTRTTYSYPTKPADMPRPTPGGSWGVTAAVFDMGELRSEVQAYSFGAITQASFGACSYEMFPIEINYPGDGNNNRDVLHYLPALGLSYLAEATYDGNTDRYSYISIEALK